MFTAGSSVRTICQSADCSYGNTGKADVWISTVFTAVTADAGAVVCATGGHPVCQYSVNATRGETSSCGFLLGAGRSLECKVRGATGTIKGSAQAVELASSFSSAAPPGDLGVCPIVRKDGGASMCDCGVGPTGADTAVAVLASSTDEGFNSFHCYVDGANVCAWGSNRGDKGDGGSCWFVVPAGAMYNCSMEWGSTTIAYSSVTPLASQIFPKQPQASKIRNAPAPGLDRRAASTLGGAQVTVVPAGVRELYSRWRSHYGIDALFSPAEQERRLINFYAFVRRYDYDGEFPNALADLSLDEFESHYRGGLRSAEIGERPLPMAPALNDDQVCWSP